MVLDVRTTAGAEQALLPIRESEHVDRKSSAEVCTEAVTTGPRVGKKRDDDMMT